MATHALDVDPRDCACTLFEEHAEHQAVPAPAAPPLPAHPAVGDMAELDQLLRLGLWKSAALIGGGILEGLLLWLLQFREEDVRAFAVAMLARRKGRGPGKLDDGAKWDRPIGKWGLYGLLVAAADLGVLAPEEADLCHRARRARNSIHVLGGEVVGEAEAREVAAAVLCVARKVRK